MIKALPWSTEWARKAQVFAAAFAAVLAIFAVSEAQADSLSCSVQNRGSSFFPESLPDDVQARIECQTELSSKRLKGLYVARIANGDQASLLKWFKRYEESEAPQSIKTLVIEKKGTGASDTWLELESRGSQNPLTHFVFTASEGSSTLVFLYTDTPNEARLNRGQIRDMMHVFRTKDYLSAIARAFLFDPLKD